jgi:hypothetical protein
MVVLDYGTAFEDRISGSLLSYYLPGERKESDISNSEELRKNDRLFGICDREIWSANPLLLFDV